MVSSNIVLILLVLLGISAANATTQTSATELAHLVGAGALEELFRLRRLVENENACALPGCTIKYDSFMTCMRRAVSRGYVHTRHAEFVEQGLRHGFTHRVNATAERKASEIDLTGLDNHDYEVAKDKKNDLHHLAVMNA